ncbi:MAG: heavy-metal-associated domain-containing protein [Clostridia bacterium]|nr:heavy-metal-associated domain-containing protein [Clostridia bacterium]
MKANKFIVTGLKDADKIPDIKEAIRSHEGINAVRIDMQASTVTVDYDEARYSEGDIKDFVSQAGLNVTQVK